MTTGIDVKERVAAFLAENDHGAMDQFTFRAAQYDAGLAMVHFPKGKGGLGLSRAEQVVVDGLLRDAGVRYHALVVNPIGIGMGAPTLLTYGTEEMHERYLKPLFTGEEIWCQLFSEPSHGSDVAGISSRGVRDGDEWVVNGQKVWTSLAHVSAFGLLLTRTDPNAPKHRGLSYFILDMHSPGVHVRPLFQITGEAEFNEVFLTDTRVPDANMLGAEGDGWRVATTTLMNERVALSGNGNGGSGTGVVRMLVNLWQETKNNFSPAIRCVYRDRLARIWIEAETLRLLSLRTRALAQTGTPGPEGSIGKLMRAELNQRIFNMCLDIQLAAGMLHSPGYKMGRSEGQTRGSPLSSQFLRSRANTIEGGTSEIMRNIIADRVLGLPPEVGLDKDTPWNLIPR